MNNEKENSDNDKDETKLKEVNQKKHLKKENSKQHSSKHLKDNKEVHTHTKKDIKAYKIEEKNDNIESKKNLSIENKEIKKSKDTKKTDVNNIKKSIISNEEKNKNQNSNAIMRNDEIKIDTEKLETIKKEISENKNKTKIQNQKIYINIFQNLIIGVIAVIYFLLIILGQQRIPAIEFITDLKTFIIFEVIASICIFEVAYKKDSGKMVLHGIEMIAIASSTLIILSLYGRGSNKYIFVIIISTAIICIYYLIKSLIIKIKKNV